MIKICMFPHKASEYLQSSLVALLETPDFEYLNAKSNSKNSLILLDKDSIDVYHSQDLNKLELGNCITCFEKRIGSDFKLSHMIGGPAMGFVAVGTMFVDLDEVFPKKGRILIYEVNQRKEMV